MRKICLALAFLLASSGAYGQQRHATGSMCTPAIHINGEKTEDTSCFVWYDYTDLSRRENGPARLERASKADSLAPSPHTVAQAAPK